MGFYRYYSIAAVFALAGAAPTLAASSISAEYKSVCADVMAGAGRKPMPKEMPYSNEYALSESQYYAQKADYCKAARTAMQGEKENTDSAALYGISTMTCLVACKDPKMKGACQGSAMMSMMGEMKGGNSIGMGAGLFAFTGGGGGGAAAASGAAGAGGAAAAGTGAAGAGAQGAAPGAGAGSGPSGLDSGSCLAAASSAMQMMQKNQGKDNSAQTAKDALDQARELTDQRKSPSVPNGPPVGQFPDAPSEVCDPDATGTAAMLACASRSDPALGAFLKENDVIGNFEKATGLSAEEYLAKGDFTAKGIKDALGGSLGASGGEMLSGLEKMEAKVLGARAPASAAAPVQPLYGGSAGGGEEKPKGEPAENDAIKALLAGLAAQMAGLGGSEADEAAQGGKNIAAVSAAIKLNGPSQLPQMKQITLFDRTTYRYREIGKQWYGVARGPASTGPGGPVLGGSRLSGN